MRFLILMAALGSATAVEAQIRLPAPLPSVQLPALPSTLGGLDPRSSDPGVLQALTDVHREALARLIRNNRRLIEADPDGQPIVRGEILAAGIDDEMLSRWTAAGFTVERSQAAADRLVVLKVPENVSTKKALRQMREGDARGIYDYNHIYLGSGVIPGAANAPTEAGTEAGVQPSAAAAHAAGPQVRVGLLDTGVDGAHPAFRGSDIVPWGCGGKRVPSAHGTAVASLLAASGGNELYAADVYCGEPTGGAVDVIVAALGWMAEEHVAVINVSLVGPRNLLLERVVGALIARGHIIVAAVGNDGPAAPPLYPAAYPDVVGVTAVDRHRRVLIEAGRGPQVMFAALGADLQAAGIGRGYVAVRGTSFAAPAVAALLAPMVPAPDRSASLGAIDVLAKRAIDLGPPGRDLTYGFGLVGAAAD
jgi:subtilisin family serine protease